MRLNTAKIILKNIASSTKLPRGDAASRLNIRKSTAKKIASSTLARGPAAATVKICLLVRIEKLTGMGFAQPKYTRSGRIIVPKRLIWAKGFRVNRPILLAVSSPYL